MSIPCERPFLAGRAAFRRVPLLGAAALALALLAPEVRAQGPVAGAFPPAAAAPAQAAPAPAERPADGRELRREIEALYEVLPLRDGVLLRPRQERAGVRSIEVAGNAIAVNGERVSEGVLRAWLGEDAGPVLRLAALPPAGRRALFELPAEGSGSRPGAAVSTEPGGEAEAAGETPEASEAAEPDEDEEDAPAAPAAPAIPPVPPVPPVSTPTKGSTVRVAGSVTVEAGETAQDVVAVGGSVRVDGRVLGDVVAVGGPVRINGSVGGDVVSVGNSVHLGPEAEVMGEVVSVMGQIHRAEGAVIHGQTSEVSGFGGGHGDWVFGPDADGWPFFAAGSVVGELIWMILLALLLCLTMALGRRRVERAEARIAVEPWKSGAVGLLSFFAFLPLVVVATLLTCCLAVLLYPFLAVVVVIVMLLGYTAVSYWVGRWSEGRFGWRLGNPYLTMLVGFALLKLLTFVSLLLSLGGGMLDAFAMMFWVAGEVVQWAALFVGIGAVLVDFFEERAARRRAYEGMLPPVPAAVGPDGYPPAPPVSTVYTPSSTAEAPPPPPPGDRGPEL